MRPQFFQTGQIRLLLRLGGLGLLAQFFTPGRVTSCQFLLAGLACQLRPALVRCRLLLPGFFLLSLERVFLHQCRIYIVMLHRRYGGRLMVAPLSQQQSNHHPMQSQRQRHRQKVAGQLKSF